MDNIEYTERDDIIIVNLLGDLNVSNINKVKPVFNEIILKKPRVIAINCSNLFNIDSFAIAFFVKVLKKAIGKNTKLLFFDLSPSIQKILEIVNLQKFFTVLTKEKFEDEYRIRKQ